MFIYDSINYNKNDSQQNKENKNYFLVFQCKLLDEVKEEIGRLKNYYKIPINNIINIISSYTCNYTTMTVTITFCFTITSVTR